MGRKPKAKQRHAQTADPGPLRNSPNWPLLAIGIAGMALTGYLTFKAWSGGALRGCSAGSACDVVLGSRWATTFGLPTSFWGFLAYVGLAAIAFVKPVRSHWRYAWTAALVGVAASVYLTTISLTILHATCPYCLTSLGLMTAALLLTTSQRPDLPGFEWGNWLKSRIPLAALFLLVLHFNYIAVPEIPDNPLARQLAEHLTATGAKFYGASWCDHCQQQKKYFGKAADVLPYVECKPGGPNAPLTPPCREKLITTFPTWIIGDRRVEGVLTITQLMEMSEFKRPTTP
jgi:uncharacterized membrane protein